jgi:TatA/E family protein of Tat protein translocase
MPDIGPVELVIILVIALLVIGPGKLPEVGAALGRSIREFRKAASDVSDAVKTDAAVAPGGPTPVMPAPAVTAAASVPTPPTPTVAMPPIVASVVTPPAAVPAQAAPVTAPTPDEPSAPVMPDPAATAADAPTEARV